MTIPPFPYSDGRQVAKGAPIWFRTPLTDDDRDALKLGEVRWLGDQWISAGMAGYLMVATGRGSSVPEAQREAYSLAHKVVVPNLRYRNDIGDSFVQHEHTEMKRLGWLP